MIALLVTALANALWQPAIIAAIAWAALRFLRCSNATTRHAVWTVALVASVCVPILSVATLAAPRAAASNAASSTPHYQRGSAVEMEPRSQAASQRAFSPLPAVHRPQLTIHPSVAQIAAVLWSVICALILGRLAFSFFYLERLKRDALPLSIDRRHALLRWQRADKGARDVRVCVSSAIRVPVAVGIFDAMILLPQDLVDDLEPSDLDRILLHELAHVRRSDDWVNLFERVAIALLFFSPGMYWIARQMDLEREVACDDWVLEQAADNAPYARCLAHIVEITQWPYRALAAPGVFVTRKSMSIRIERLLARGRDVRIRLAIVPSVISLLAIVAVVIAGGFASPTIAYTLQAPVAERPHHSKSPLVAVKRAPRPSPIVRAPTSPAPSATAAIPVAVAVVSAPPRTIARATSPATPAPAPTPNFRAALERTPIASPSGGYLDELQAAGMTNLDPEEVVSLRSVGVTGEYIVRMRGSGIGQLNGRDLVTLKSVGVTPEYLATMSSAGLKISDARTAVQLKSMGVTPDYVANLAQAGYSNLSGSQYAELKSLGIDRAYIEDLARHGFSHLPVQKLLQFKAMGIEPQ